MKIQTDTKNIITAIVASLIFVFGFIGLILFFSFFSGIVLWILWPHIIPQVFPKIVSDGYLANDLTLFQSIGLCFVSGILIKSRNADTSKKTK